MQKSAVLLFMCVIHALMGACSAREPFSADTQVRWLTVAAPEVHVLIKNETPDPVEFSLSVKPPESAQRDLACEPQDLKSLETRSTLSTSVVAADGITFGLVPAQGWAHRIVPLAESQSVDCVVPLSIQLLGGERTKFVVEVPIRHESDADIAFDRPAHEALVTVDSMIERDKTQPGEMSFIARTLVANNEFKSVRLKMSEMAVVCGNRKRESASSYTSDPVAQLLRTGPYTVRAGEWAVFAAEVTVEGGIAPNNCRVEGVVSIQTKRKGFQVLKRVVVRLDPTGFNDDARMH